MFALNAEALSKLATENQLPTVGANRRHAEDGGSRCIWPQLS